MALLRRYGALVEEDAEALSGNLIVLAVPDEENLSAGMRTAVLLLAELRDRYGLKYQLMINSEPHQRKDPEVGVLSTGSVGKLMPFVYVRGYLAHVGKVFEGFNPVNLLSAIVRKTEVNMQLSDVLGKEAAPPPTWLFCRDQKLGYDVSIPLSAAGCLSVLTLNQTPATLLEKIRHLCQEAFQQVLRRALSVVDGCSCDTSCYQCLRNYYNQKIHDQLSRRAASAFLHPWAGRMTVLTEKTENEKE